MKKAIITAAVLAGIAAIFYTGTCPAKYHKAAAPAETTMDKPREIKQECNCPVPPCIKTGTATENPKVWL